ncbi:hypothetical protein [Gemmobacter sp. LW-1]|uniref:hypothetical protein n=1 Tax=Gemmobacter sp. LW-1 TaxID=1529005 RepID=UPI0006C77001|nr:hypothetical protein [Gemmobacter sp. LW-1]
MTGSSPSELRRQAALFAKLIAAQAKLWSACAPDNEEPRERVVHSIACLAALFGYRLEPISTTSLPVTTGILPGTTVGAPHD